jgi:hypothetical protein
VFRVSQTLDYVKKETKKLTLLELLFKRPLYDLIILLNFFGGRSLYNSASFFTFDMTFVLETVNLEQI